MTNNYNTYLTLVHYLGDLAESVTDFMATDITSTTVTLSWSPPVLAPISYEISHICSKLCDSTLHSTESDKAVTSPHSTAITPYSQCGFSLIGVYGAENAYLITNYLATTPSAGKILFLQLLYYSFTQLLLYQSIISHSHQ